MVATQVAAIETKDKDIFNEDVEGIPVLECDYDQQPHILYQAMEAKRWKDTMMILTNDTEEIRKKRNGGWMSMFSANTTPKKKQQDTPASKVLSMTWVSRKKENGEIKWRLLPIHAAVIFKAPKIIIETLLEEFPEGARLREDRGNLPLHLAFKHGVSEEVIGTIISAYPPGVGQLNHKKKTPFECISPELPKRGMALFVETAEKRLKEVVVEHDDEITKVKNQLKADTESRQEQTDAHIKELQEQIGLLEVKLAVAEKGAALLTTNYTPGTIEDLKEQNRKLQKVQEENLRTIESLEEMSEKGAEKEPKDDTVEKSEETVSTSRGFFGFFGLSKRDVTDTDQKKTEEEKQTDESNVVEQVQPKGDNEVTDSIESEREKMEEDVRTEDLDGDTSDQPKDEDKTEEEEPVNVDDSKEVDDLIEAERERTEAL